MQRTVDSKNKMRIFRRFESFEEYLDHCAKVPDFPNPQSRKTGNDKWSGTPNFEAAMQLARNGWREGLALIEKLSAQLDHVAGNLVKRPEVQWDVSGDFADAGLFVTGVPECMGQFTEVITEGAGKIVKVTINGFFSCGFDAETIMRRGAATLALIDALETAGRSCELVLALAGTNYGGDDLHVEIVPLKKAGEALELDRLAFMVAHPSSFRRLGFSAGENEEPDVRQNFGCQNGYYYTPAEWHEPDTNIVVPEASYFRNPSEESLLIWIKGELKKQGCQLEGELAETV